MFCTRIPLYKMYIVSLPFPDSLNGNSLIGTFYYTTHNYCLFVKTNVTLDTFCMSLDYDQSESVINCTFDTL